MNEGRVRFNTNLLLFSVFIYLVGPNTFRVYNAYVADFVFLLTFVVIAFNGPPFRLRHPASVLFLVPFGIVTLSNIGKFVSDFPMGVDEAANTIKTLQLYFIFVLALTVFDPRMPESYFRATVRKIGTIVAVAVIYNSVIGILQYFEVGFVRALMEQFYLIEHSVGISNVDYMIVENRITGIFDSWNGLGFFLTQTMFLMIVISNERRSLLITAAVLLSVVALLLAGSRAASIGLLLMVVLFYIGVLRSRRMVIGVVVALIVLPVVISGLIAFEVLTQENVDRFVEIYDFVTTGTPPPNWEFRLDTWSWLPEHILGSPYFLFGYPNQVWKNSVYYWGADNQYLAWLLAYGLVGALGYPVWWFSVIASYRKRYRRMKRFGATPPGRFIGAVVIIWSVQLLIGISQDSMLGNRWRELFLIFMGLSVQWCDHLERREKNGTDAQRP